MTDNINEMRLERYRMEQGTFNEFDEKAKESIPVNSTKCCKSVREAMEEATNFMSTHVCPEIDKDVVQQMTKRSKPKNRKRNLYLTKIENITAVHVRFC